MVVLSCELLEKGVREWSFHESSSRKKEPIYLTFLSQAKPKAILLTMPRPLTPR
jgi:hypothetical protein